jgi:hypothetical protein
VQYLIHLLKARGVTAGESKQRHGSAGPRNLQE